VDSSIHNWIFESWFSHVVRFSVSSFQQYDLPVVERLLTLQSDGVTLLEVRSRVQSQQQELVHQGFFLPKLYFLDAGEFSVVDVEIVAVARMVRGSGCVSSNAHLVVVAHEDFPDSVDLSLTTTVTFVRSNPAVRLWKSPAWMSSCFRNAFERPAILFG